MLRYLYVDVYIPDMRRFSPRMYLQNSVKNKKELAASRNEYLKAKKEKKKAKWAEIEKEVNLYLEAYK